jgi:hypothetical protein
LKVLAGGDMVQNIFKIVDAGHFWCKPSSRSRAEAEKYYTLIGKINDYCCNAEKQPGNQKSKIPRKGKVRRTGVFKN